MPWRKPWKTLACFAVMIESLYLSVREFIRQAKRVNRGQRPPQIGEIGCRRPCPFSTILANMTEDERQYLLRTVAETHASLSEVALKLRQELSPKAPALKTVIKADREIFRLKRELQRLDIEVLEQAKGRQSLPEVRQGGKVVAVDQLLRQSGRHNKP